MKLLPALAGLFLVWGVTAQELVPNTVVSITGECRALLLGDEDVTEVCEPELLQISYIGGQIELFVGTGNTDGRFLVFAGAGARAGDLLLQTVDTLTIGLDPMGNELNTIKAGGHCRHGDPFAGPAEFSCEVNGTDGERYVMSFSSDGRAPDNMLD